MSMKQKESNIPPLFDPDDAMHAELLAASWYSEDSIFPIFLSEEDLTWYLKSRGTSMGLNGLKSWEYVPQTLTLTLDFSSGQTIRLTRDPRLGIATGAGSTGSNTASESYLKIGSESGDQINPSHYQLPGGLQLIDLTEQLNFCRGNAIKYLFRAGKKNPTEELEDLKKALWYVQREIDRVAKNTVT